MRLGYEDTEVAKNWLQDIGHGAGGGQRSDAEALALPGRNQRMSLRDLLALAASEDSARESDQQRAP
eukprot:8449675-Alexandrium_andersonii.AAC.1